jgi:hypothetical protein
MNLKFISTAKCISLKSAIHKVARLPSRRCGLKARATPRNQNAREFFAGVFLCA